MMNSSKKNKIVDVMVASLKSLLKIEEDYFINHEYKVNIGTLYKRSEKESNSILRFKERFKWKFELAPNCVIESMGR